jgi:uncharacterized protein (TIGR04255 family)
MKRTHPPLRLPRSPLIYVVAQVNISAVVAIERYIPEIQEKLRKNGFPGFISAQIPELIFETPGAKPVMNALSRFEFQDKEERTGIVLSSKSIAVHTNQYNTFDQFHKIIAIALETIHAEAQIQLRERIGLRYVDLIVLEAEEKLSDYLAPRLLGYEATSVGVNEASFDFKFEGTTPYGVIVARHCPPMINNMFPPDLMGVALNYNYRERPLPGKAFLLDFDHATVQKRDFVVDEILESLETLHDGLDILFRNTVTQYALDQWGRENA